ncbi:MAG: hypothetical protein HC921_04820 [Synechococcaceae cyanobacterium SM2_3_1]|nr:hypothetical protein [Synechococcaceae cyanobacterium SM2_3_1]
MFKAVRAFWQKLVKGNPIPSQVPISTARSVPPRTPVAAPPVKTAKTSSDALPPTLWTFPKKGAAPTTSTVSAGQPHGAISKLPASHHGGARVGSIHRRLSAQIRVNALPKGSHLRPQP